MSVILHVIDLFLWKQQHDINVLQQKFNKLVQEQFATCWEAIKLKIEMIENKK
jgi:hypothetical protein